MEQRTALIVGATGLVGSALLGQLLESADYSRVITLVRRPTGKGHRKLVEMVVNFDRLGSYDAFQGVDDVYCCLGTTIKKAGSQEAFRRVDFAYPQKTALEAKRAGCTRFLIVTAMGADPNSGIFYNRVKGEVEQALRGVGLPELHIFRPSLLLGQRAERRVGEAIASVISRGVMWAMVGPLKKYRPVAGAAVARAMVRTALSGAVPGAHLYLNDQIIDLGK